MLRIFYLPGIFFDLHISAISKMVSKKRASFIVEIEEMEPFKSAFN